MGRIYSASYYGIAVTAVQDLLEINAPSDAAVRIHELTISQSSDAGDTESEQLQVVCHRGSTAGSGGSSLTPAPREVGDAAFDGTASRTNTTQSTEGAILHAEAFNVMAGLKQIWTPETRPVISPSGRFVVALKTAPADSLTFSLTCIFEEIGG